jgi:hypothetical protein
LARLFCYNSRVFNTYCSRGRELRLGVGKVDIFKEGRKKERKKRWLSPSKADKWSSGV